MTAREQRLAVGSALCVALAIVLMLLIMQTAGCGAHVSGTLDADTDVGYTRLTGDTEQGICGEYKPRWLPIGVLVCYDADGKARVCVTSDAGALACYERGL